MELKNRKGKGNDGRECEAIEAHVSSQARSRFSRFAVSVTSIFTIVGGIHLTPLWQNNAMAQPPPKTAPRETSIEPAPIELNKRADAAAEALRSFILTGNAQSRDTFNSLWKGNNQNDIFFNKFIFVLNARFKPLFKSVSDGLIHGPAVKDKAAAKESGVDFPVVIAAVQAYYDEISKPEAQRDRTKLVAAYGETFVSAMDGVRKRTSVPVRQSEEQAYNYFVRIFDLKDVTDSSTLQAKSSSVMAAVKDWFGIKDDVTASAVTRALIIAYSVLDNGNDRKLFGVWLNDLLIDPKKAGLKTGLVSSADSASKSHSVMLLPHMLVLAAFRRYKKDREEAADKAQVDEAALKRFPRIVRSTSLSQYSAGFETAPTDMGLEEMGLRLEYLRKKRIILEKGVNPKKAEEIAAIDKEISGFKAWLATLSIKLDRPEDGLMKLRSGFQSIQLLYFSMDPSKPGLLEYIAAVSPNNSLSGLYKKYLLDLDRRVVNVFSGISPKDPNFIVSARRKMEEKLSTKRVLQAQVIWKDYVDRLAPTGGAQPAPGGNLPRSFAQSLVQQVLVDPQLLNLVANLDPLMATAFLDYQEIAQARGLARLEEKKLVVATIAKLYAVNMSLVPKYLASITSLAKVCEDNYEAYVQGLAAISARVDAVAAPLLEATSPQRMTPLNMRQNVMRLADAFEMISKITRGELSRYDRLNLMDDRLRINPNPPHSIEQRAPGYAPRFLTDNQTATALYPPSPLPNYMQTPTPGQLFNFGSIVNSPMTYDGRVQMPTFMPLHLISSAGLVGLAGRSYFYPQHTVVSINPYLPNTNITPLSPTRLLNDINRAFVPIRRLDYDATPIGGGGGLGFRAYNPGDTWEYGGGALASLITPTGGAALGGSVSNREVLAGTTAVAMPIGKIRILPRTTPGIGPLTEGEIGIDSAIAGYQKDRTKDSSASKSLIKAISSQWDPNNPSQLSIAINSETTVDNKTFMTARYYFVDRDGTIYEVKGGENDLVRILNYAAVYSNSQFGTPTTYAGNYEPAVKRGGGMLVVDIGKTALLAHAQAIPFLLPDEQPMPFLLQWTVGGAHTLGGETNRGSTVAQITFPGKMLLIDPTPTAVGTAPKQDRYILQDIDFMLRRVRGKDAWELRTGAGLGTAPTGLTGRGGVFIKFQKPENERAGGGIYYEGGATNMEAMALLSQAQEAQRYIQSLHRIGTTLYGSTMTANRLLLGGLAHVMPQWSSEQGQSTKFDTVFWRGIGVLKALKWGARLDVSRISGLDQMMSDYEQLNAVVGQDPANAAQYIKQFQDKYTQTFKQVLDKYSLTIQVRKDFSLDATLISREAADSNWVKQVPDTAYARLLYTWDTGFTRAFAMMPITSQLVVTEPGKPVPRIGIVGTGAGTDLLDSIFLPRMAMDVGLLLARKESDKPADINAWKPYGNLPKSGFFVQGGVVLFSNLAEDSKGYRKLVSRYERYNGLISEGKMHKLPDPVRKAICDSLDPDRFDKKTIDAIRGGDEVKLRPGQLTEAQDGLYQGWFYGQMTDLQRKFDGHMRSYLSASGYFYGDKTYWDIGAYVEYVDRLKAYIIVAGREDINTFAGGDYTKGRFRISTMMGISSKGKYGAAASAGMRFRLRGIPMEAGLYGYGHTDEVPDYAAAYLAYTKRIGRPDIGILMFFNLLGGGPPVSPMMPYQQPGPTSFGGR